MEEENEEVTPRKETFRSSRFYNENEVEKEQKNEIVLEKKTTI